MRHYNSWLELPPIKITLYGQRFAAIPILISLEEQLRCYYCFLPSVMSVLLWNFLLVIGLKTLVLYAKLYSVFLFASGAIFLLWVAKR
jgi:hypothetical protein